jgi:CheY-like chemotaxis protein
MISPPPPSNPAAGIPLRLLLIEDHAELAAMAADYLRIAGLEVRISNSGGLGVKAAAEFHPQIVLCDFRLPDMSGFEVARALRLNPSLQTLLIAIHTAHDEKVIRALESDTEATGIDLFLSKPLSEEKIEVLLSRYMSLSRR